MELPVIHVDEVESASQEIEKVVQEVEKVASNQGNDKFIMIALIVMCVICIALCCVIFINFYKNKKNKEIMSDTTKKSNQDDKTPQKDDENKNDIQDDIDVFKKIVLLDTSDPSQKYECIINDFVVIGQKPGVDIMIEDTAVSREHCKITVKGNHFYLEDCASTNGTKYDGYDVDEKVLISNGGIIEIGRRKYKLMII